ncbi:MAG: putative DNA binding domain-containing protein [Kiritimatiellae bacterium]|nr:putative DNA binding domain-containing protein [Kiritimatiellia bacterium]
MTLSELQSLTADGETLTVEFKSDRHRLPDGELVDALAAMANAQGGVLLEGVEDDGRITGLHPAHRDFAGVVALVANRTTPGLTVFAETIDCGDGLCVGVIHIKKSRSLISTNDGKYLRRRLDANRRPEVVAIRPADMLSWQSSLGIYDPSAMLFEGVRIDELDPIQRVRIRQSIEKYNGDRALLRLSDDELDAALGLVGEIDGVKYPTLAGLLFLGTEKLLRRHVPSHEVAFQVLCGSRVKVNEFRRRPLLEVFEEYEILFGGQYSEEELDVGLFRVPIPNYDRTAFREAFVNALVHRDYSILGAVHIQFDDLGLSISSPGGFIEGVTVDTLLTAAPKSRNLLLADIVKRIGLAERTGRGVDRIYEGMLRYGRMAPDYSESNNSVVRVRMFDGKADTLFLRMLLNRADRGMDMPVDALLVLSSLRDGEQTIEEVARMLKKSETVVRNILGTLLAEGMVEQRIEGRVHAYFLGKTYHQVTGRNVAYTKTIGIGPIKYKAMVIEFIEQHGKIKCGEAMELCDMTRHKASNFLAELSGRGVILRNGSGRWTYYTLPKGEIECS